MRVTLSIHGDAAEQELRSLYSWLLNDSAARRWAEMEWEASVPAPTSGMGTLLDLISLAIGSGFSAASLAVALAQWHGARGGPGPAVTVRRPDGTEVVIETASVPDAERLLATLIDSSDQNPEP